MEETPRGSHRVLLSKEEIELIIKTLDNAGEEELANDLRMVLEGTL